MAMRTVNGLLFLTIISNCIKYWTAQYLVSTKMDVIMQQLKEVNQTYNLGGFTVSTIDCYNAFKPIKGMLIDKCHLQAVHFLNPHWHVPHSE